MLKSPSCTRIFMALAPADMRRSFMLRPIRTHWVLARSGDLKCCKLRWGPQGVQEERDGLFKSIAQNVVIVTLAGLSFYCSAMVWASVRPADREVTGKPRINAIKALNGALLVTISSPSAGAEIFYTLDDGVPSARSTPYEAPFLISSSRTVRAIAKAQGEQISGEATREFRLNVPHGALVWSEEFNEGVGARRRVRPDPELWRYNVGADTNHSVGVLCAYNSSVAPCEKEAPNSYVGTDGDLHVVAQQPVPGVYTSANLDTRGKFSFRYGRLEARIWVPEGQGIWPAFWLLGNDVGTVGWPACGEVDIMERIDRAGRPPGQGGAMVPAGVSDWNKGSIHGRGFTGDAIGGFYYFHGGATAAGWHTYGIIKTRGAIEFYVDDASHPYAKFTPQSIAEFPGGVWPFDNGQSFFIILNIAVGGDWPGEPNASTPFPAAMRVDYIRLYKN